MPCEVAILVSTWQRPAHLHRCLASIAAQRGVDGAFEVVVTDDGSSDETASIVQGVASRAPFRVGFTTHPHDGFQLSRCRNEGVAASTAPYLLFIDGDCLLPHDHIAEHLRRRRPSLVLAGNRYLLDRERSEAIDEAAVARGEWLGQIPASELKRVRALHRKARWYEIIHHRERPKLIGCCIGVWREDYAKVNGFDENFRGWGCEDDDINMRLRRVGARVRSIADRSLLHHLWHPPTESAPSRWREGANVAYLRRPARLTRCRNGLVKRGADDLSVAVVGERSPAVDRLLKGRFAQPDGRSEVELVVAGGRSRFSGRAEYNLLLDPVGDGDGLAQRAHLVVSARPPQGMAPERCFTLERFEEALAAVV